MILSFSRFTTVILTLLLLSMALRPGLYAQEKKIIGEGAARDHRVAESIDQIIGGLSSADDKLPDDFDKLGRLRALVLQQLPIIDKEIASKRQTLEEIENAKSRKIRFESWKQNRQKQIDRYKRDISRLETEIEEIQKRIRELENNSENNKKEITEANKLIVIKKRSLGFAKSSVRSHERQLQSYDEEIKKIIQTIEKLGEDETELSEEIGKLVNKRANFSLFRDHIEAKINKSLARDVVTQNFKANVSMVFAGLVFVVIAGFFVIAYRDPAVRRTIFSGDSGIQFLTLFSIVIAIILFGITGILGDKELAAILSGVAGYILGRGRGRSRGAGEPTEKDGAPSGPGTPDTPKSPRGRRKTGPANAAPQPSAS